MTKALWLAIMLGTKKEGVLGARTATLPWAEKVAIEAKVRRVIVLGVKRVIMERIGEEY